VNEPATHKAVLFDLDGTLLDTLADLADSTNRALQRFGFAVHPVEAYKTLVGDGAEKLMRRAAGGEISDELAEKLTAGMREEYARRWAEKTRPYEGVGPMLDALAQRGVPMAVLSNKPHGFTRLCVAELLPHWRFAAVRGADAKTPIKPDPTAALQIARQLGFDPGEFLYVGDTNTDMHTACAGGMFPVGVTWGFRSAEELKAAGAAALIDRPAELLELL